MPICYLCRKQNIYSPRFTDIFDDKLFRMEEEYRHLKNGAKVIAWLKKHGEDPRGLECIKVYGISIFKHDLTEDNCKLISDIMHRCNTIKRFAMNFSDGFEELLRALDNDSAKGIGYPKVLLSLDLVS